ncbi:MAG: HAD family hydrolase [Janthinobacterium lividum]
MLQRIGATRNDRFPLPYWLLIFDLDGTLIDSSRDLCASVNATLAHLGRPPLPDITIANFIGDGAAVLVARSLRATAESAERSVDPNAEALLVYKALTYFLNYYHLHKLDTTVAYAGVLSALNTIRDRYPEILMAVLTNKPLDPSRDLCSALGLSEFMFAIYGGDSFSTKKPHPEGLLAIMQEGRTRSPSLMASMIGFPGSGVVMVGDSPVDVLVARSAGVRSLGCRYGLCPEQLDLSAPDLVVNSPSEWIQVLESLASH